MGNLAVVGERNVCQSLGLSGPGDETHGGFLSETWLHSRTQQHELRQLALCKNMHAEHNPEGMN